MNLTECYRAHTCVVAFKASNGNAVTVYGGRNLDNEENREVWEEVQAVMKRALLAAGDYYVKHRPDGAELQSTKEKQLE